jgi:hypothetical protein
VIGVKPITIHTLPCTVYCQSPSREDMTRPVFRDLRNSALSVRPRPNLDAQRSLTGKKGRRGTELRVISPSHPRRHHGVQGWPAIPRARRYNPSYRDRQNITSRLSGVLASSYPIKGQARTLQGDTDSRQYTSPKPSASNPRLPTQRSTSQVITSVLFFLSLRLGLAALSHKLVNPTQAPRCKKIQNSPPRWT